MAKEQFKRKNAFIAHEILDELGDLTESEQLELLKALLIHSRDNIDPQFEDRLMRNIYNRYAKADDENKASYLETCENRRLAALEREEKKRQEQEAQEAQNTTKSTIVHEDHNTPQQGTIVTDKDKDKDKDNIYNPPYPPMGGGGKPPEEKSDPLSEIKNETLRDKTADWLKYKAERREKYKPAGLKSLITQIKNYADRYGAEPVCEVIAESMGSGYKGIAWDRIRRFNNAPKPNAKPGFEQREFDEQAEKERRIKAMIAEGERIAALNAQNGSG